MGKQTPSEKGRYLVTGQYVTLSINYGCIFLGVFWPFSFGIRSNRIHGISVCKRKNVYSENGILLADVNFCICARVSCVGMAPGKGFPKVCDTVKFGVPGCFGPFQCLGLLWCSVVFHGVPWCSVVFRCSSVLVFRCSCF